MEFNLKFCDNFNYPHEVKEHFNKILNLLKSYNVISVILLGSTARGELIYEIKKNEIKIYSDYDILIVIDKHRHARELKNSLLKLVYEVKKKSTTFNLDFKLMTLNQLFSLPRHTYAYSLKNRSLVIGGKDIRNIIPNIDLYNIDIRQENENLIVILWYVLYYMPSGLFNNDLKIEDEENLMREFKFIICKYALQIVPWLLLLEGNLINSIDVSKGVDFIKTEYHKLRFFNFMGEEFLEQLDLFREGYFHLKFSIGTGELYNKFINCIFNALRYLIYCKASLNSNSENIICNIMNNAYALFNDRMMKARIRNFYTLYNDFVSLRDYRMKLVYPYIFKRSAFLLSSLLSLHFGIRDYFRGGNKFWHPLIFLERYFIKNKSDFGEKKIDSLLMIKQSVMNFILTFTHYPWLPLTLGK